MQAPGEGRPAAAIVKMGKYMKKSKPMPRDVSLLETSPHSLATAGVRTRAKTLALQRLRRASQPPPPPAVTPNSDASSSTFSYLQLRSRRLLKPCLAPSEAIRDEGPAWRGGRAESGSRGSCDASCSARAASLSGGVEGGECIGRGDRGNGEECACDAGVEASFGENDLDIEDRDRNTRESTPCSLIRALDANTPPGSTTRQRSSYTAHRTQMNILQSIPASDEVEEFFACAERRQQRSFMEKYNFDIVKDLPLPGRFEWVQLIPSGSH